ncbi:hypothetical protein BDZ91DRAFT_738185, partial [Kalaharituber pfeilii]
MWFLWLIWSQVCNCRKPARFSESIRSYQLYEPLIVTQDLPPSFFNCPAVSRNQLQRRSAHLGRSPLYLL